VIKEGTRPLAIAILSTITHKWDRSKYFFEVFKGRIKGFWGY
jgi:hypothetical protein